MPPGRVCHHSQSGWWPTRGSTTRGCGNRAKPKPTSVLRTRSVSVAVFALTISRASEARSRAAAVCSTRVSSKARASESSGAASFFSFPTPTTPSVFVPIRSGTKYQGMIGSVPVSVPAGSQMAVSPTRSRHGGRVKGIFRRPSRRQSDVVIFARARRRPDVQGSHGSRSPPLRQLHQVSPGPTTAA